MNSISNISLANLTALAAQAKSENNEVRTDNSGRLKEKESSIGLSNNKARQQHRNEAISAIKTAIKQEYSLADDDVNKLMGGPKEKITIGDLKSLLSASEKLDQFSKKQKTELKAEIKQIEKQVATNSSAIATIKSDIQEKYQNLSDEDINQLVGNTKKEDLISEKIITGENKTLLDKSEKLSGKLDQLEVDRKADVMEVQQQVTRNKGFAGLLKSISISVANDIGITTYNELNSAASEASNNMNSKVGKNIGAKIDKNIEARPKKMAKKDGKDWKALSQQEQNAYSDKYKQRYVGNSFVANMTTRLLTSKAFFNEMKASSSSGLKDAQLWAQADLVKGKMINSGGVCYGLVTSMAVEIANGKFTSSSDFLSTLTPSNYEVFQDLQNSQLAGSQYSSITEVIFQKRDQKPGIKLESGFNEIHLRRGEGQGGHAVSVYAKPNSVTFFDPNYGLFEFDNIDKASVFVNNLTNAAYPDLSVKQTLHFDA